MKGTIKWYSDEKGYGYVVDPAGKERFFGAKHVQGTSTPSSGDSVSFKPGLDRKGAPIARSIQIHARGPANEDPREICRHCNRKMTPRVVVGKPIITMGTWTPEPKYSLCPYCAGRHKDFQPADGPLKALTVTISVIFALGVGGFVLHTHLTWDDRSQPVERTSPPQMDERRQQFEERHQRFMEQFREE
ncbi:cold-shock DNA-binding domain protein (plasmid) [Thioalkalivibrio sp. K90mix]|uniref:cold shock domain-containing protein n=1 Tax=Thioalkalivibrio sp. (strain K90mix) TaxID=396595 RepID=UPI000195A68E|nr:cold shock domain-containing protein [Thioalkalivibrio sp. K90mix]ADC73264.1 cold-shock DNA-binding domain protein [Thioalkalivibrio sp. K90mix]